jgi:hypothetical protein
MAHHRAHLPGKRYWLRLALGLVFGWLNCLVLLPAARSATGGVNVLPLPGRLNTSGVRVVVDTRGVDSTAYRPVRIEIHPLKSPAVADRTFRVVVRPHSYYGNLRDSASQIIELEQGATKATGTVLMPQDSPWHSLTVDVHEDGRTHGDLSGDHLSWSRGNYWNWHEGIPSVLLIDSKAPALNERDRLLQVLMAKGVKGVEAEYNEKLPDIRNLLRRFPNPNNPAARVVISDKESRDTHAISMLNEIKESPKGDVLGFGDLPTRWLELSGFDLIFLSRSDLQKLAKDRPEALKALAEWNRAGGILTVFDAGDDFAGLEEIEKRLTMPRQVERGLPDQRNWRTPDKKNVNETIRGLQDDNQAAQGAWSPAMAMGGGMAAGTSAGAGGNTTNSNDESEEDKDRYQWKFVVGDNGLGQVVAFTGNPFPGNFDEWTWFFNSIRGEAWNPPLRLGASQRQENEEFWNFLIPGTGQAPVLSFLVFITLFVALIGPVNYYVLSRAGRLYLLLVTVPVGALLVTGSLFLYAVVTDGLGVKSRLRSYTALDQRAGTVASTSRQAYYASIAPSQGFDFRDDTAIIPYVHKPVGRYGHRTSRIDVRWDEKEQNLRAGYIHSRTLSQLLVTRSGESEAKLVVGTPAGDTLKVTNNLGMPLQYLLVHASDDKYYAGENLAAGEATLKAIELQAASLEFARRLRLRDPQYPTGYDPSMHDTPLEAWSFGGRYYGGYGNMGNVSQTTSLLERRLARFTRLVGNPLEKNTYAAISETSPEVPIGVGTARQYESLHVIEGQY